MRSTFVVTELASGYAILLRWFRFRGRGTIRPTMFAQEANELPGFDAVPYETRNAFHGTTAPAAASIWRDGKFLPSGSGRFGPGTYFWENSRAAAKKWVQVHHKTDNWGLVRARVHCTKMMDLLTAEHFTAMERTQSWLKRRKATDYNHAAVLAFLHAANLIDGARLIAGVSPQTRVHQDSRLAGPFDVILCIYDPMNIIVSSVETRSTQPSAN